MENKKRGRRLPRSINRHQWKMNKTEYLGLELVTRFTDYIATLLDGAPFHHEFAIRDRPLPRGYSDRFLRDGRLTIHSLKDAFDRYWWDGGDFAKNKEKLDKVASTVDHAMALEKQGGGGAADECLDSIHEVLKWGAGGTTTKLYTANIKWARDRVKTIVERVRDGRRQMTSDDPIVERFSRVDGPRMNAGFTKYYSLACGNDVIIYDGRVGGALGLLVREFCKSIDCKTVPPELSFLWGDQNSENPLNRNPSTEPYLFRKLPGKGGAEWARVNILANWVLGSAVAKSKAKWCQGGDGLRRVEAALFTIGYEIPRAGPPVPKPKKALRNAHRGRNTNLTKVACLLGPRATAFRYSGNSQDGLRIEFGAGVELVVSPKLLIALTDTFEAQIVALGADRTNTPAGSIGDWLSSRSQEFGVTLNSQHAARLTAVLKEEGIVDVVPNDELHSRGIRGRRPIRVQFIGDD